MEHVHPLQAVLLALLTAVAAIAVIARRLQISYPILLVLAGLVCSLLPHIPRIPLPPYVVMYVFLPPLLYVAAWQTSWREFRFQFVSIAMLAVGLVLFTAVGAALCAHLVLPGFDWRLGFVLGAVVSPTDAVAATSIARRLNVPHQVVDLLEGESLLNDATGLLALQFGLQLLDGSGTPSLGRGALELLWLAVGGLGAGLLVGWLVTLIERWIEEGAVEIVLSVIIAYTSYLAGEAVHASGVISVVVTGLYLSRRSDTLFSPQARLQVRGVWDALEFLLNGLVFLLLGLQLHYVLDAIHGYSLLQLCLYGLGFSAVLIALRLLWMYPGAQVAYLLRTRLLHQQYAAPNRRATFVVGWTGMRGVVSLAAASSLPYTLGNGQPLPQRNLIVFFTFTVILVTLVLQGLTLPALVRALAFQADGSFEAEETNARRSLLQAGARALEGRKQGANAEDAAVLDSLLHELQRKAELLDSDPGKAPEDVFRSAWLDALDAQRTELNQMRFDGKIGDAVFSVLQRELDLGVSRLRSQQIREEAMDEG